MCWIFGQQICLFGYVDQCVCGVKDFDQNYYQNDVEDVDCQCFCDIQLYEGWCN